MEEEEKPKILVDAAIVVEAITTVGWEKNEGNVLYYKEYNIIRVKQEKLRSLYPELSLKYYGSTYTTLIHDVKIVNRKTLFFSEVNYLVPDFFIAHCELGDLKLIRCNWVQRNQYGDVLSGRFFLFRSIAGDLLFEKSILGNINILGRSKVKDFLFDNSQFGDLNIASESQIKDFQLKDSKSERIIITGKSLTGNFSIYNNSQTGYFGISGESQTGYFGISGESQTGYFNIDESRTGNFIISDKSRTEYFGVSSRSRLGDFKISKGFLGSLSFTGNSKAGNFIISNRSEVGDFIISEQCEVKNFSVSSKSQMGDFIISESGKTMNINISEGSQMGDFRLDKLGKILDLTIIQESIVGDISIKGESRTGRVIIGNSYFRNLFVEDSFSTSWSIEKCFASFSFNKATIRQFKILNCKVQQLLIKNQCEIELYVSGGQIDHLNFKQYTLAKNSIVSLSSVHLYLCNMFEFTVLGNLYFRNIEKAKGFIDFDVNYFKKPNDYGTILNNYKNKRKSYDENLAELKGEIEEELIPTFRIVKSSLSKTEFTESDLEGFNFEYKNSRLIDVYINGGKLPKKIEVYEEGNPSTVLDQQKSFFNQLKKMFETHGDIVRSTLYRAKAAEIQTKISWLEKNYWEWLVYKINEISNSHGISWLRALGFTLGLSLIGFIFYNAAFEPRKYKFVFEWNLDWLGYWAYFTLPIHKINFMGEPNSWALFIDVLFRILVGYGIYQFIFAFRKHGKR